MTNLTNNNTQKMTVVRSIADLTRRNSGPLYTQYFVQDNFAQPDKTLVMKLLFDDAIDYEDIRILEFVYETRFSVKDQILRWCAIQGIENGEQRLERLTNRSLLNQFFIAIWNKDKSNTRPKDALMFYCLKSSAKYLIEEYTHRLYVNWNPGDNFSNLAHIENCVLINEIYLHELASDRRPDICSFKSEYTVREYILRPSFVCTYKIDPKRNEYIVYDILRTDDNEDDVHQKIQKWEEYFLRTKFWTKTFIHTTGVPTLVFVTDDEESAEALEERIRSTTKLTRFVVKTFDEIRNAG